MNRVADTLAAVLHEHGIRHAFGMPGGEVLTVLDALRSSGIAFHLARHETAAAIMAAGAFAATGAPGLLLTTIGPGLANAVNGILDAAQERVPLVVVSGVVDRATRARFTHQVVDHAALLRAVVKGSFEVEAGAAAETVARALRLALSDPMGPVHLDIAPMVAASADPSARRPTLARVLRHRPAPADPAVTNIRDVLAKADRPLVLAGLDAARAGASDVLVALAERIGAPVVTTYKAKGVMPEDHRLSLGGAGLSPAADALLLDLARAADVVLAVGYDPIEMRIGWIDPAGIDGRIVEIGSVGVDHGMHRAATRLAADPRDGLAAVLDGLPGRTGWPGGEPAATRAALQRQFDPAGRGWGPHAVVAALAGAAAGDEAIVTVDSGAHRILLSQMWCARRPLRLLQSAGLCTMASALPLAIGAKAADPGRPVFAVMGDGGLEMCLGELATLRDLALPVTIVVFQDDSLALIALKQRATNLAPCGVALGPTDFAAVAQAFGGVGRTVDTRSDLEAELAAAALRPVFSLIACRFDANAYQGTF